MIESWKGSRGSSEAGKPKDSNTTTEITKKCFEIPNFVSILASLYG
jgi:hypothetical protein